MSSCQKKTGHTSQTVTRRVSVRTETFRKERSAQAHSFHNSPFVRFQMSETLPPVTANGVLLHFVFPFDEALSRRANISWVHQLGGREVVTIYAHVEQGGKDIVHTQARRAFFIFA